jgi:hypothetical protein
MAWGVGTHGRRPVLVSDCRCHTMEASRMAGPSTVPAAMVPGGTHPCKGKHTIPAAPKPGDACTSCSPHPTHGSMATVFLTSALRAHAGHPHLDGGDKARQHVHGVYQVGCLDLNGGQLGLQVHLDLLDMVHCLHVGCVGVWCVVWVWVGVLGGGRGKGGGGVPSSNISRHPDTGAMHRL